MFLLYVMGSRDTFYHQVEGQLHICHLQKLRGYFNQGNLSFIWLSCHPQIQVTNKICIKGPINYTTMQVRGILIDHIYLSITLYPIKVKDEDGNR
jgi:hypothetical protein